MPSTHPDTDLVARIKERLDLAEQVIIPDIGPPQRRGHRLAWVCPFHPDRHPSLFLNPDGQSYRCFGCGARGDAFTWMMARRNWAFRDALAYLAGLVGLDGEVGKGRPSTSLGAGPARTPVTRKPAALPAPPSTQWQVRAQVILQRAQAVLWENAGAPGRAYLADRGLHEATLRAWGLGWCPRDVFDDPARWGLTGKRVYLPRGVVIPHFVGGELWALKIRRFAGDLPAPAEPWGKYGGPRGGQIALFGLDRLSNNGDRPLFLVESELDALLLWQAGGDLVDVLALGSAGRTLPTRWLAPLLLYVRIYAALDADGAGTLNAARLTALSARIALACIPVGNDVTEFAQQGGDVRAWVMETTGDSSNPG